MRACLGALFLIGLVGCTAEKPAPKAPAHIELSPELLDFGSAELGTSITRELTLLNTGDEPAQIQGAELLDPTNFKLSDTLPDTVPAKGSARVSVTFQPKRADAVQSKLTLLTDAPTTSRVTAQLAGTVSSAGLVVHTSLLDFGPVLTGEEKTIPLRVENTSTRELQLKLQDATRIPAPFTSTKSFTEPLTIAPGTSLELPVTFRPTRASSFGFGLRFEPCPSCTPTIVNVKADGIESYFRTDPSERLVFKAPEPRGPGALTLQLGLINDGDQPLTVSTLEIEGAPSWAVLSHAGPLELPAHSRKGVSVSAYFSEEARTGRLKINTNDPRRPEVFINLEVPVAQTNGCLLIAPDAVNFGTVKAACSSTTRLITIYNVCSAPVQVESLRFGSDPAGVFGITTAPTFPRTVTSTAPVKFEVRFIPRQPATYQSTIEVKSNVSPERYPVSLIGNAKAGGVQQTDTWQQPVRPKADMLFVIDNSPAMQPYQASLRTNIEAILDEMGSSWVDYHIAVTTTDVSATGAAGRFLPLDNSRPVVVTSETPDWKQTVLDTAMVGTSGSSTENQAFEAMRLALSPTLLANENAGFLRPSSWLSIIFVSATAEGSPNPVDYYANELFALRAPNSVSVSTVSVPQSTSDRFAEMSYKAGGVKASIQEPNWADEFRRIAYLAFQQLRSRFYLTTKPASADTIETRINGTVTPPVDATSGAAVWTYSSASNSIDFTPTTIPPEGATVEAIYEVNCREW